MNPKLYIRVLDDNETRDVIADSVTMFTNPIDVTKDGDFVRHYKPGQQCFVVVVDGIPEYYEYAKMSEENRGYIGEVSGRYKEPPTFVIERMKASR
jgi:hypothetical protein